MNPEELFRGESETIEYKATVAPRSEAYMKTVIAFANGRGGQLLFGVEDVSGEALGLGRKAVFKYMDAVANAIASKCHPRIHPHIYLHEIDRKPIIIVDVPPGVETPYWIQNEGIANGTYVRVGATTRRADRYRIEELILRGQNKFYDQGVTDTIVKEAEAHGFCDRLYEYARAHRSGRADNLRKVSIGQLLSWGALHEADHHFYASNGYLLLGGGIRPAEDAAIQCAVYKGTERGTVADRATYNGVFFDNIDRAVQFVRTHLESNGLQGRQYPRSRLAALSDESIREIITNAVCHRSYQAPGHIQVALFDDRLEVSSPGGLDCSLAVEDIERGRSRVRNRAMASVLEYVGMFEGWGNGIPHLIQETKEKGLPAPHFSARPGDFLVRLDAGDAETEDVSVDQAAAAVVNIPIVGLLEPTLDSTSAASRRPPYEFVPYDDFTSARLTLSQEVGVDKPVERAAEEKTVQQDAQTDMKQAPAWQVEDDEAGQSAHAQPESDPWPDLLAWLEDEENVPPWEQPVARTKVRQKSRVPVAAGGISAPDGRAAAKADSADTHDAAAPTAADAGQLADSSVLSEPEEAVLQAMRANPGIMQSRLPAATNLSLAAVRSAMQSLADKHRVGREGGRRYGRWVVLE